MNERRIAEIAAKIADVGDVTIVEPVSSKPSKKRQNRPMKQAGGIKRWLEDISEEMGLEGEITEAVKKEAEKRLKKQRVKRDKKARRRKAGGTIFTIKRSPYKYRGAVERMMPRWFDQAGDYSGEFVKGSVEWKSRPEANLQLMSVLHSFTFQQQVEDGSLVKELGKVEARMMGSEIVIQVLLYS
jgi:hypothetical protein